MDVAIDAGIWVGALLGLVSTVCYSAAAVTQRRLAVALPQPLTRGRQLGALLLHPLWWWSVLLNAGRAVFQVGALALAPLTVVQPIGVLVLVFGLPASARLAGRRVRPREWCGAVVTVTALGVLLWVAVTGGSSTPMGRGESALVILGAAAAAGTAAWVAGRVRGRTARSCLIAVGAGICFGAASAAAKTAVAAAGAAGAAGAAPGLLARVLSTAAHPAVLGTVLLALLGVLLAQAAYQGMEIGAPLGATALANPLTASLIGVAFMGETYAAGWTGTGIAVLCALLAAYGIALMANPDARPAAAPSSRRRAGAPDADTGPRR
ncbi:DMT family transporter [Nocardiopsis coralliicola]